MSREIKFRVWDNTGKAFIYFDIYNYPSGVYGGVSNPQQYTGLKDKNGKKIYEGDIVSFSTDNTVCLGDKDINEWQGQEVYWDNQHATFIFGHRYEFTMLDRVMEETLTVQGNIFETPDILENLV
jgi:uncharacterized phage protein (TIGR01671 family)